MDHFERERAVRLLWAALAAALTQVAFLAGGPPVAPPPPVAPIVHPVAPPLLDDTRPGGWLPPADGSWGKGPDGHWYRYKPAPVVAAVPFALRWPVATPATAAPRAAVPSTHRAAPGPRPAATRIVVLPAARPGGTSHGGADCRG